MSSRKFTDYEKKTVYARSNGRCALCGSPVGFDSLTIDHKVPLSQGGTNEFANLQLACWKCNQMKGCMGMAEFLARASRILAHNWKGAVRAVLRYAKDKFLHREKTS